MVIDEDQLGASLYRGNETGFLQLAQILRGSEAFRDPGPLDEPNLAIRLLENQLDEFLAEDQPGQDGFRFRDGVGEEALNGVDLLGGAVRGMNIRSGKCIKKLKNIHSEFGMYAPHAVEWEVERSR